MRELRPWTTDRAAAASGDEAVGVRFEGSLIGTVEARIADSNVRAVFCQRAAYGSLIQKVSRERAGDTQRDDKQTDGEFSALDTGKCMHKTQALRCDEKSKRGEDHADAQHDSKARVLAGLEPKRRLKRLVVFKRKGVDNLHDFYCNSDDSEGISASRDN
jgi:hypothetical protein